MNRRKMIIAGIGTGAVLGIVLSVLSLMRVELDLIQQAINYIVAPPTLLTVRLRLPELAGYIILILYFSFAGFIFAWLISSQSRFRWVFSLAFIIFIAFLHWEADQQLTRDFETLFNMMHNIQLNDLGEPG